MAAAVAEAAAQSTPTFRDFTSTWLSEHQVEWSRSHIKVLTSTLDGHMMPAFGDRPVATITKAEILAFRAKLADLPGRVGDKLINKRINGNVDRSVATLAALLFDLGKVEERVLKRDRPRNGLLAPHPLTGGLVRRALDTVEHLHTALVGEIRTHLSATPRAPRDPMASRVHEAVRHSWTRGALHV